MKKTITTIVILVLMSAMVGCSGMEEAANTTLDTDLDGIVNDNDNCPNVDNSDQADSDGDGTGDACEPMPGGNGCSYDALDGICTVTAIVNSEDAVLFDFQSNDGETTYKGNWITRDVSEYEIGEEFSCSHNLINSGTCTPCSVTFGESGYAECGIISVENDTDADGISNYNDSCPNEPEAFCDFPDLDYLDDTTMDLGICDGDYDGCPNTIEDDDDGDFIPNDYDNCPSVANLDQADADDDGVGDACEIHFFPTTGVAPREFKLNIRPELDPKIAQPHINQPQIPKHEEVMR